MVYVDNFYKTGIRFKGMKMCHMIADTRAELLQMVKQLGLKPKWVQSPNTTREHFDICYSKRKYAVKLGAKEIGMRTLATMTNTRDYEGYKPLNLFNERNELRKRNTKTTR